MSHFVYSRLSAIVPSIQLRLGILVLTIFCIAALQPAPAFAVTTAESKSAITFFDPGSATVWPLDEGLTSRFSSTRRQITLANSNRRELMAPTAATLWYNGNSAGGALPNGQGFSHPNGQMYTDFDVTGANGWDISAVFSNNLMNSTITQAKYEIRTGVTTNNGGTLLYSGTAAATQVATGLVVSTFAEYRVTISGLNIHLPVGKYFLNVAPISAVAGAGVSYNSNTNGVGAVGSPPGNNNLDRWTNGASLFSDPAGQGHDFSNGVIGNATIACVAPTTTYVDDNWAGTPTGDDPDGGGPATNFGCNSFATVQGGVNGVATGGTVIVYAGTYTQAQVLINRSMTVTGIDGLAVTTINGGNVAPPLAGAVRIVTGAGETGTTTFQGFTVTNPGLSGETGGTHVALYARPLNAAATTRITNSKIQGVNASDNGFYSIRNLGTVEFDHNVITNTAFNPIVIERSEGPTNVHDNNIFGNFSLAYFNFTYAATNVTFQQRVADNTIDGSALGAIAFNSAYPAAPPFTGTMTNILIANNVISQVGPADLAITLQNRAVAGTGATGLINGAVISGNFIYGTDGVASRGIRLAGLVTNTSIIENDVRDVERGFSSEVFNAESPTGTTAHFNNFVSNAGGFVSDGTGTVDAENNWWGCNAGPGGPGCDTVTGTGAANVDYNPWIVLGVSASPNPINVFGTSTVTADMTHNSNGVALGNTPPNVIPNIPVAWTGTNGTMSPTSGTITNGAASSTFTDTNPSAPAASACAMVDSQLTCTTIEIILQADLAITKTDGVTTATPGGTVTYAITASNAGPSSIIGAAVTDSFPATLTATWTCAGAGGGTCTAAGAGNINDTVNLPAGGSVTYTVSATISPAATGSLSNTATVTAPGGVTDPTPGNNSATDTDTLAASADLSITKTDGVTTATAGGQVTYIVTASNAGPSNSVGANVSDIFPASTTVTWTCVGAGGGTCTAAGSGNINDTVNLPVGGSVTYTAIASIASSATGTLANTATVTAPGGVTDPTPGNNSATDTDTLVSTADLSITKTDGVATATPGGSVTYTITASNAGPSDVINAIVSDTFPASTTVTWTCVGAGGGTCTGGGSGNINNTVNLPAGSSVTYTATASISSAATGTLTNTATVTAPDNVIDPALANNSATDTDTLVPSTDLAITKTDGSATYTAGTAISYAIVVSNNGPSDATGASVSDTIPAAITGTTISCTASGAASCGVNASVGSNLTFTGINIPVGEGNFVTITASGTVNPATTGNLVNTATVTSGQPDATPGNNTATDTDTPNAVSNVSITKTDGATSAAAGSRVVYTIVVSNTGPGNVVGATVTDTFSSAIVNAQWTCLGSGGGTCGQPSGTGNINQLINLPAGGSVTYTVAATISSTATGTLANTATVTLPAGTTDPNPADNSATDVDTITGPSIFVIDDVSRAEGNAGTTAFTFTITKTGASGFATNVQYQTFDGTATVANLDYQPASGTLSFGPNDTSKTVTVLVNGDTAVEPTEFFTLHLQGGSTTVTIGDADGRGTIVDDDGSPTPTVTPTPTTTPTPTVTPTPVPAGGFEGDINRAVVGTPGTGDGDVNVGDQIQYQRFLSGTDCPSLNEQRRLDAGPRASLGDGLLGSTDGTAIDAYARHDTATDFDPNTPGWQPTPVGGPPAITNLGCTPSADPEGEEIVAATDVEPESASAARVVRVVSRSGARNSDIIVDVEMTARGNEAGTQYGLSFDPTVLAISGISGVNTNPDVMPGAGAPAGTTLNVNADDAANGRIGIIEIFSGANASAIAAGTTRIARVKFHVLGNAAGTSRVDFDNSVINGISADARGMVLSANYEGSDVSVSSSHGVTVSGRVTSSDGRGLRGTTVTIIDEDGTSRTAITSAFGYYAFEDVAAARHTITVSSRLYRYASRTVDVSDDLTDVNFTGLE